MKKILTFLAIFVIAATSNAFSQEEQKAEPTFSLELNQDPATGFYPSFYGGLPLCDDHTLTFYGTFWTADYWGGGQKGINLMTEFGVGVNFSLFDEALNINPSIGFAHGNYTSGGGRPVVGDNIVPSLSISYESDIFNLEINGIMWKQLRKEGKVTPYMSMMEYSIEPYFTISNHFSLGLYVDHFLTMSDNSNMSNEPEKSTSTDFFWVGPRFEVTFKNDISAMLALGVDGKDYFNTLEEGTKAKFGEFYKLSLSIPF